jgi:hypothetical protein
MVGQKRGGIPESLVRGRDRFEAWRGARIVGARIPNQLWTLAVKLAKALAAHQLSVLFSAGDPDRTATAPDWRPVGPHR